MFEFILFGILLFVVYSRQSSRIDSLESKIDSLINKNQINTPVSNTHAPAPVVTQVEPVKKDLEYSMGIGLSRNIEQVALPKEEFHETSSGQILGRIGIGALVLGVSFFLKYAFDNNWIAPSGRVLIGVLIGVLLLVIGQYYRKKYQQFSEIMFGGGVAVLYLSMYVAYYFYHLISGSVAGVAMILITLITFALSIWNEDSKLALIATIGGFLTPIMVSDIGNNMIGIFGYITFLNLGVLAISLVKKWPVLIFSAILGTVLNFSLWYFAYYEKNNLDVTVFFLTVTFFIFLWSSLYRIIIKKEDFQIFDNMVLILNISSFYYFFYNIMNPEYESSMGFFTLLLSILFMFLSYFAYKNNPENKPINIILPGIAVVFLTMSIPIQFSDSWVAISVAWFAESVVLSLLASRMPRQGYQFTGSIVYAVSLVYSFVQMMDYNYRELTPFYNESFFVMLMAIICAYIIVYIYDLYGGESPEIQKTRIFSFVILANFLTIFIFTRELNAYFNINQEVYNFARTAISIFWAIYATVLTIIGFAWRIVLLRLMGLVLFVITAVKIFIDVWDLGAIYRIVSFIGFGVIAIAVSFLYAKYKDRLKTVI